MHISREVLHWRNDKEDPRRREEHCCKRIADTNRWVCIEARNKEAAAHENPHDEQAAGVRAAFVELLRILETLPAFPEDVCTDIAAGTFDVIKRLRKDIDSEKLVAQCAATLKEVQHRKKRHTAIAREQKRLAIDNWAKEPVQGSMAAAHKHLKSSEVPPPLPE